MGWEADYLAKQSGKTAEANATSFQEDPGWLYGFGASIGSGFVESFGADPFPAAEAFANQNPMSGFVGELTGAIAPYLAGGWASGTVRGAKMLEGAMTKLPGVRGLTATDNPVLFHAAKEAVRYSPVELARLGVGLGTTDDWSEYGDLMADVGLSTVLTGGFGGIGGFFRAGGKVKPEMGRVIDADLAFAPTWELRMSRAPGAQVSGDLPLGDVQKSLFKQALTERPFDAPIKGVKGRYIDGLENGTPESDAFLNQLFKPSGAKTPAEGTLLRRPLMKQDGTMALAADEQTEMLGALGLNSMEELAESGRYIRDVSVGSERAAGTLAKAFDESEALQYAGDGVMMAKNAQGGLWVIGKRWKAGGAEATSGGADTGAGGAVFGQMKIAKGDRWLIMQTDQPQRFLPASHKVAELNVAQWAKYRDAWKPTGLKDVFNTEMDLMQKSLSVRDYRDLANPAISKQTWIANTSRKLTEKLGNSGLVPGMENLTNSVTAKNMVEQFYDILKPTMFKEGQDALYGRLFGFLKATTKTGDSILNKIIGGSIAVKGSPLFKRNVAHGEGFGGFEAVTKIFQPLSDDEVRLVFRVSEAQQPMEMLEKLTADGMVSDTARKAIESLQGINRKVWEDVLHPAFKNAEVSGKFDLLEGYIMPRMFSGDWFVPVVDDAGNKMFLANGTLATAKKDAEAVVKEAADRGLSWKVGGEYGAGLGKDVDEISSIHDLVQMQMGKSKDTHEVIEAAMKKMELERMGASRRASLPEVGLPKSLTEKRTGIRTNLDDHRTKADAIKAIENHYRQLFRFAGYSTWRKRWLSESESLAKSQPVLARDLHRKANQYMGYEGQITNTLNKALTPLFGSAMGGKAATRIAQSTNELMYNWNLAIGNPTFALLNLLTPLQTVTPLIAFVQNASEAHVERLMGMTIRHGADGLPRAPMGVLHPMKVLGQSFKEMKKPDDALKEAYARAKQDGTLMAQLFENFVGGQSKAHQTLTDAYKNAGGGVEGGWAFIKRTATFMAEKSEEVSRLQAFTSAHILGRDMLGMQGDQLYRFAATFTHKAMYGYSVIDRSRMFTGPIGSMFGLFKNWQMHFIGQMVQNANLAMKDGVWSPLLWQFGAATAVGGLGATPLKMVADGLARWQTDAPSSFLWMQENWSDAADEIYFGLPALFGASLQASASLPGTDVRNDLSSLSSFVFLERAKAAGKAVGEAWDYYSVNDKNPLKDGNVRDKMLNAFAPRAVFRGFAAVEGDYIKSMSTGYPQVRGVSALSKTLHGLGFNQTEVEQQQVAAKELWKDQEKRRTVTQQLGIALADAWGNEDYGEAGRIMDRATMLGIEQSKIAKSATTRQKREAEGDALTRFDADRAERYITALQK